jgi:hypothetical protein
VNLRGKKKKINKPFLLEIAQINFGLLNQHKQSYNKHQLYPEGQVDNESERKMKKETQERGNQIFKPSKDEKAHLLFV